jgi:hypothetical protein
MATQEQIQEIERIIGFRYPASFVANYAPFSAHFGTDGFRRAFPDSRLLLSAPEVTAARATIPNGLLPFMRAEQAPWPDIFSFDLDSAGPEFRVVVWSDHAIVMVWESFPVFLQWVLDHISKNGTGV